MDSAILEMESKEEKAKQQDFLLEALNYPNKIDRIFRASEYDFKAAAFHKHCDGKEDNLVLVRTEFDMNIGGFSHKAWTS